MSFAYIGKDFYLVASPKGGSLSKGGKSQVVQPELEVSCKTSFIPHAQSPAAAEEHSLPCRKVVVPSTLQVLGETASSGSLEQSPSLPKPH